MRADLGIPYGGQITTGGLAWRHNCSCRLEFRHGKFFDSKYKEISQRADGNIGNFVEVYMSKNKTCPPDRHTGFYTLRYDIGVDYLYDLIDMCIIEEYIIKRGAYFDIIDLGTGTVLKTIQGMSNLYKFLEDEDNRDILEVLEDSIDSLINTKES